MFMAVDLGLLAVQAGPRSGGDIIVESLPYVPRGNEAAGNPHTRDGSHRYNFGENL